MKENDWLVFQLSELLSKVEPGGVLAGTMADTEATPSASAVAEPQAAPPRVKSTVELGW